MRFEIEWLDDGINAAPEERATACDLRIRIGNTNVTEHLINGQRHATDHVTIASYALVEGLAHDWWTIFGARDQVYRLTRHRSGFALPEIGFQFNGKYLEITTSQRPYGNPPIRFWQAPATIVSRREAEEGLESLIVPTIDRLGAQDINDTGAQLRWARVMESRRDADEQLFCECAGALGHDPYDLDDVTAGLIEDAAELFSGEPLIEFLAGIKNVSNRRQGLEWVRRTGERPPAHSQLPRLADLARDVANDAATRGGERAFELGYRRARALRRRMNLDSNRRVDSVAVLTQRLGAREFAVAEAARGLRAVIGRRGGCMSVDLAHAPQESGMLFSLGRAVGQLVCFPNVQRAAVNSLDSAFEQAAGRAFAAEFLAPIDEIRNMLDDGRSEDEIAAEVGVSELVIKRQIENADRIEHACAAAA